MDKQPKDKQDQIPFDLPVNRVIIFSNHKNIYKRRIERRQRSLMANLSFLKHFLTGDEKIFLVTTACSPISFRERFWIGLNTFDLKCSLLVFTDKRVFHVPAGRHYTYRNSIAHFFYGDCISIRIKGLTLIVEYKNGRKEKFNHIAVREEKKVKSLLKSISFEGPVTKKQGRVHLCPRCTNELEESKFTCANCSLEFKDKTRAKKISIVYPGGGYFYTKHPFLGIADAAIETILFGMIILSLLGSIKGVRYSECGLLIFSFALLIEKMLTIYHSNNLTREYIPKEKEIRIISGGQSEE